MIAFQRNAGFGKKQTPDQKKDITQNKGQYNDQEIFQNTIFVEYNVSEKNNFNSQHAY